LEKSLATKASKTELQSTAKKVDDIVSKHDGLRKDYDANVTSVKTTTDKLSADISGITTRVADAEGSIGSLTTRATGAETEIEATNARAKREYRAIHSCITTIRDIGDTQFATV